MTRDQLLTAIREGIPFVIRMADGEKYEVSDRYRVALGQTTVMVVGGDEHATRPAIAEDDWHQLFEEELARGLPQHFVTLTPTWGDRQD